MFILSVYGVDEEWPVATIDADSKEEALTRIGGEILGIGYGEPRPNSVHIRVSDEEILKLASDHVEVENDNFLLYEVPRL